MVFDLTLKTMVSLKWVDNLMLRKGRNNVKFIINHHKKQGMFEFFY
jgi:archaellum component FlaD/FlaE